MNEWSDRLWKRVRKSRGCWIWLGGKHSSRGDYGSMRAMGKVHLVHRLAWIDANGSIPAGMCVCHKCDNPVCVRPSHLFLGTASDNMADMARKGRHRSKTRPDCNPTGETNPMAKLTSADVAAIRAAPCGYGTGRALARRFGVSEATISFVRSGKRWPRH